MAYIHTGVRNCTHGSTQLVHGSTAREGTVEICVDGIWGSICDNGWDSRDAQVVCHQLGFVIFGMYTYYINAHLQHLCKVVMEGTNTRIFFGSKINFNDGPS